MYGSHRNPSRSLWLASLLALGLLGANSATARIYTGTPSPVGNGFARVAVATDASGAPTSVSLLVDANALQGLPEPTATQHEWEYVVAMPQGAPATGYDHVVLNWNPKGHPPQGVYSVPHFDVHFYVISRASQEAVTFQGNEAGPGLAPPDARLIPAGYVVPPDTAVERMGAHGINPSGPEFHGKPFTHTFIYGYYRGSMIFVEPMVTLAYLKTLPDVTTAVRTPATYSATGYYPTKYRIGFDRERGHYSIALLALRPYTVTAKAR